MKSLILLSSVAFTSLVAQAQKATVDGVFKSEAPDSVTLSFYHNLVDFSRNEQTVAVGANGHFTVQLALDKPLVANFSAGNEDFEIYLEPGQALNMTMSEGRDEEGLQVKYEGSTAAENELLTQLDLYYQQDEDFKASRKNLAANEREFLKTVAKKYKEQRQLVEGYFKRESISPFFQAWLKAELTYGEALQKLQYPEWRGAVTRLSNPYALSASYFDFLNQVPLQDDAALSNVTYLSFLQAFVAHRLQPGAPVTGEPAQYFQQYELARTLLQGEQQNVICGRLVHESIKKGHLYFTDRLLADYCQRPAAQPYVSEIKTAYAKHLAGSIGSQARDLKLEQKGGQQVNLAAYKGQPVYVYFYTTSQGSARNEVTHAQELAKSFAGQPVKFLYVCLDSDGSQWHKQSNLWQWPGTNTLLTGDSAAVMRNYGLTSLPAAYLLDADGKILDAEAPRPAQVKQLTETLSKALALNNRP